MAQPKFPITPCLWFDMNCEEAINLYVSVFNSAPGSSGTSRIVSIERYPEEPNAIPLEGMDGKILTAIFELEGQKFMALDGGPMFKFNEAVSFSVECETQDEVDHFWGALSAVPEAEQCGWLKDKFGVSWQIVPRQLGELLSLPDKPTARRVLDAMLGMKKFVIADLERAAEPQ